MNILRENVWVPNISLNAVLVFFPEQKTSFQTAPLNVKYINMFFSYREIRF